MSTRAASSRVSWYSRSNAERSPAFTRSTRLRRSASSRTAAPSAACRRSVLWALTGNVTTSPPRAPLRRSSVLVDSSGAFSGATFGGRMRGPNPWVASADENDQSGSNDQRMRTWRPTGARPCHPARPRGIAYECTVRDIPGRARWADARRGLLRRSRRILRIWQRGYRRAVFVPGQRGLSARRILLARLLSRCPAQRAAVQDLQGLRLSRDLHQRVLHGDLRQGPGLRERRVWGET